MPLNREAGHDTLVVTGLGAVRHAVHALLLALAEEAAEDTAAFGVAGAGFTGPLFNSQVLGFQQEAAEAQAKQAVAQYEQTVLTAFREVEDSLVAVRTSRTQSEAQQQQVAALQSALHLADLRYKGGLANYLDVLVARRNLFEAELALTGTRRLHLVSVVQLPF